MAKEGKQLYHSKNLYSAVDWLYVKNGQAERNNAKIAAARATARTSFFRCAGISSMTTAATSGVKVIMLSTGKFIIYLLEQHDHGFVDHIQDPCGIDADPQDQSHQRYHNHDLSRIDLCQLRFTVHPMF